MPKPGGRGVRPSACAVCTSKARAQIEMARVGGTSLDKIAAKYGISRDSVHRHFRNHVSKDRRAELMAGPARVHELANAAAEESQGLLEQLQIVRSVLLNQFLSAAEVGDRMGVANVAGRLLESLRELGKLTGELRELSGISITNNHLTLVASPGFAALQEGLLTVARAHPEARGDIVSLLRNLDDMPAARPNDAFICEAVNAE